MYNGEGLSTHGEEKENKMYDKYFWFVFMLIYGGLRLDYQTKVDGRRLCDWKWNTNDCCNERRNATLIFESMSR